jgi:hypothetical protein
MIWPHQNDVISVFGNPRGPDDVTRASLFWEAANLIAVKPPFQLFYDGQPVRSVRCHRFVATAFTGGLEAIRDAYSNDPEWLQASGIAIFGGSYNYRLMRGLNTLSMHSYGIAFDFDPARNGLGDPTPNFANYPEILKAWESVGAIWGGTFSRHDGMHWQFAGI